MLLLLSTAGNLYWLGRYSERLKHYDKILYTSPSRIWTDCDVSKSIYELAQSKSNSATTSKQHASLVSRICNAMSLPNNVSSPKNLFTYFTDDIIETTVKNIEANVQQVRGVISQDTFELYNLVKRLTDSHSHHAAALQLYASDEAMNQENNLTKLFWQIGVSMENIDNAFRLKRPIAEYATQLAEQVYSLPANTAWHELDRSAGKLKANHRLKDFEDLSRDFSLLLAKGV